MPTRMRILRAAEAVFAELGFEGATTRRIAERAGVNLAMLSYYYGSKAGTFRAVMEARGREIRAWAAQRTNMAPARVVEEWGAYVCDAGRNFAAICMREAVAAERSTERSEAVRKALEPVQSLLVGTLDRFGGPYGGNEDTLAFLLVALPMLLSGLGKIDASIVETLRCCVTLLERESHGTSERPASLDGPVLSVAPSVLPDLGFID